MTQTEQTKFDSIVAKGKTRYALKYGVSYWGGFMMLMFTFFQPAIHYFSSIGTSSECKYGIGACYSNYLFSSSFFTNLLISVICFGTAGYFVGLSMWKTFLKKRAVKEL